MPSISVQDGDSPYGGRLRQQVYSNPDGSVLPIQSTVQKKWRTDFQGSVLNPLKWDAAQVGSGMAYTTALGSWLNVTTGTTLDDEVSFLTKESFSVPFRGMVAVNLSQRIVGQTVFIEFVSIDDTTGLPDGMSAISWRLDGASATAGIYEVSTGFQPRLMSPAVTIPSTASTTWSVLELESFADESWFHGRVIDSPSARSNSYTRQQQIPDPDKNYKLRLRVVNRQWIDNIATIAAGTGGVIRITRNGHGLTTGDNVTVTNVSGLTGITFPWTGTVTAVDANVVELNGTTYAGTYVPTGWVQMTRNLAPATTTTVQFNFVTILDYTELTAEITAGRGGNAAGQGISVNVNSMPTTTSIVAGQQAEGSATGVNPVLISGLVRTTSPTLSTGRTASLSQSMAGQLIVKNFAPADLEFSYAAQAGGITTTGDVQVRPANATLRTYITGMSLHNNGTSCEFVVKDGASILWRGNLPTTVGTYTIAFPTPLRGTVNTALNVAALTAGCAVYCNLQGYQGV